MIEFSSIDLNSTSLASLKYPRGLSIELYILIVESNIIIWNSFKNIKGLILMSRDCLIRKIWKINVWFEKWWILIKEKTRRNLQKKDYPCSIEKPWAKKNKLKNRTKESSSESSDKKLQSRETKSSKKVKLMKNIERGWER